MQQETRQGRKWVGGPLPTAVVALAAYAQAGEKAQSGKVLIDVGGGIFPSKPPRTTLAPIQVLMEASIGTTDKSIPPELKQIGPRQIRHPDPDRDPHDRRRPGLADLP